MLAPPLVPVPPITVRRHIADDEWTACLQSWIQSIEARLHLSRGDFVKLAAEDTSSQAFVASYVREASLFSSTSAYDKRLKRLCFILTRRLLLEASSSALQLLLNWSFISSFLEIYGARRVVRSLLPEVWSRHRDQLSACIEDGKTLSVEQLSSKRQMVQCPWSTLRSLSLVSCLVPEAAQVLMTGSDYIDTLFEAYKQPDRSKEFQHGLVANLYVGLCSLATVEPPPTSLLLDQLYNLKTAAALHAKAKAGGPTLLSAIVCSTDVLYRLEAALAKSDSARGRSLLASLQAYQRECHHLHQVAPFVQRAKKGKKPTTVSTSDTKLHLVSEVKELLPDLEDTYILRLLDHYSDNVEMVVAHLLDNSVPPEFQNESGLTAQPIAGSDMAQSQLRDIDDATAAPKLPERRNIFDNDQFDKLAVPSSRVRDGHAKKKTTADDLLEDRSDHARRKAAVLSALAAFDSDDDERDDTYDIADVGGSIDAVAAGTDVDSKATVSGAQSAAQGDLELFRHYKRSPATFDRGAGTRRSAARAELRKVTGMTDEAIEGWAVMLGRDPKRSAKLEQTLVTESVVNRVADTTDGDDNGNKSDDRHHAEAANSRGGNRGSRGRGRGGKQQTNGPNGRGGTGRGRGGRNRGAHDRRNQHAKKMARAGAVPPE